uniref:Uncharacterized protein n=1 Tax=Arundo donax TaxID=35708 RepID=A0A0A9HGM8_ARUDO
MSAALPRCPASTSFALPISKPILSSTAIRTPSNLQTITLKQGKKSPAKPFSGSFKKQGYSVI